MKRIILISILFAGMHQLCLSQSIYKIDYNSELTKKINTRDYWEVAPVEFEGGLVYMSSLTNETFVNKVDDQGRSLCELYIVKKNEEAEWDSPEIFSKILSSDAHDGPATFAQKGTLLCFARAYAAEPDEKGNLYAGLYFSNSLEDGSWTAPEPFEHNDPQKNYYSPNLTEDGNTLYFAAVMEDSADNFDLYVSNFSNGRWSQPENLGSIINTDQDEMYPFFHPGGRLYFSSMGHDLNSVSDIFYSNQVDGNWTSVEKMERPINDGGRYDYALIMSDDFSNGYFTRRRPNGEADIYRFFSSFPVFDKADAIEENSFCYRIFESSLDTFDYEIFDYEWVINDTLKIPGHDINYCFPGPGDYHISFNVTNKLTDTAMYGVTSIDASLDFIEQPVITCPDTVIQNEPVIFSAENTYLPDYEIDGYYWDFGLGDWKEGETVIHYFRDIGKKRVILGVIEEQQKRLFGGVKEPEKKRAVYKDILVLPESEVVQNNE